MATFVVCHGAWGGGWAWRRMRAPLQARGHALFAPTYTGLGERFRHLGPTVGLATHIDDVVATLFYEDLSAVTLVGHSYGGMVATGVADREPGRIARLIYLDAFVPADGQSVLDFLPGTEIARAREAVKVHGAGWLMPPSPLSSDVAESDAGWLAARRMPQPFATFTEPIRLDGAAAGIPRAYVYCTRKASGDAFAPFAARYRSDPDWVYREIDSGHAPNTTAPERLAEVLAELVAA
jgi:pimeloyl-ACP methyl ester carboxylesterase